MEQLVVYLQKDMSLTSDEENTEEEAKDNSEEVAETPPKTNQAPVQKTSKLGTTPASTQPQSSFETGVVIVTYTDDGFIPSIVEVEAGNIVRFVNAASKPMWVTSTYHPTAIDQYYPEFDEGKSAFPGETYIFLFSKVGVWGYKNLNNEKHLGAVSVLKQD